MAYKNFKNQKEYDRFYYKLNRIKRLKQTRKWAKEHPEIQILAQIKQRISNPKCPTYRWYGGRGIKNYIKSVKDIIKSIGKWPGKGYSIDRINNEGHYEIGNIRWATMKQQRQNARRNNQYTKGRNNYGSNSIKTA